MPRRKRHGYGEDPTRNQCPAKRTVVRGTIAVAATRDHRDRSPRTRDPRSHCNGATPPAHWHPWNCQSLLLSRLCEALDLTWRHYNASLINYDDLVGYPLPDDAGNLKFVQTPASIWGAEAVFIDEISRCRPDMLNRLFPIIHERRIQGLPLTDLRFRWAAMNPPSDPDADEGNYVGSEPLDPALADRFPYIITIPAFATLSAIDQKLVIQSSASRTVPRNSRPDYGNRSTRSDSALTPPIRV